MLYSYSGIYSHRTDQDLTNFRLGQVLMRISSDDVKHVAKLAELEFSDEEVEKDNPPAG